MEEVKERPILFSSEMVKAILDGRKTQTRRVIKEFPVEGFRWAGWVVSSVDKKDEGKATIAPESNSEYCITGNIKKSCPHGKIGDILYVREAFHVWIPNGKEIPHYRATNRDRICEELGWKPSIHMPKKFSRIKLEITGIRVERLQDITDKDCIAEGIDLKDFCVCPDDEFIDGVRFCLNCGKRFTDIKGEFEELWDSINEKRGYGFEKNPWCWALEFKKLEK